MVSKCGGLNTNQGSQDLNPEQQNTLPKSVRKNKLLTTGEEESQIDILSVSFVCHDLFTLSVHKLVLLPHFPSRLHEFSFKVIILLKES